MGIRPLDDRVVLKVLDVEETTPGGIVLPDTAKEKPQKGKVEAVGSGRLLENGKRARIDLEPGDVVLFGKYAGTDVKIGDEEYKIVQEREILAKIEE